MTTKQALAEAHKRWGRTGNIQQYEQKDHAGITHSVGLVDRVFGMFFVVKGQGLSWDEAFADATKKRQAEIKRYVDDWTRIHGSPPPADKMPKGENLW